jgi:transposase-like protein
MEMLRETSLSMSEIARRLGVHHSAVSRWATEAKKTPTSYGGGLEETSPVAGAVVIIDDIAGPDAAGSGEIGGNDEQIN